MKPFTELENVHTSNEVLVEKGFDNRTIDTLAGVTFSHQQNKSLSSVIREKGVGQSFPEALNQSGVSTCCVCEELIAVGK